jgi:hypothetical protein
MILYPFNNRIKAEKNCVIPLKPGRNNFPIFNPPLVLIIKTELLYDLGKLRMK